MKKSSNTSTDSATLRQKAEAKIKRISPKPSREFSESDILKITHELQVQQVEIEMQNEELENALTEARFATELYDFAPVGYFALSRDGVILSSNLMGAEMLGRDRSHLESKKFSSFVSIDSKPDFIGFLDRVFKNCTKESCEITLSVNDNPPTDVQITGIVTEIEKHCLVTSVDITERKRAEKALKENETSFKNLFGRHSAIMLIVHPATGMIIDANDSAARFYGYEKSALKLMNIYKISVPSKIQFGKESEYETRNNLHNYISRHKLASGDERIVEVQSSLIDFQGNQILFQIIHDITERKINEEVIQLKNEQLIKINAEKDKFFSILAHDLRGPFNGFLGLTQIMAENLPELTTDEAQKIAESMQNSATNLFRLLENLLHWARFEQGLIPFNPKRIHLYPVIRDIISFALDPAAKKGIEITYSVSDDIMVYADSNMLQTIMRNLVSNAVKFTSRGGKIAISAKTIDKLYIQIAIQDTGIGMNQALLSNLFKLDVQSNRKGTDGELSTGLGLILCKEFIEKHKGQIRVVSEVGTGSTFYVTFPSKSK